MKFTILIILMLLMAACASPTPVALSESQIQTAIAQTMAAQPAEALDPTDTPSPTKTSAPTKTPAPTKTSGPTKTRVPTRTPTLEVGSRRAPYPVGESVSLTQNDTMDFIFTIKDVIRGEEAWNKIINANQFNEPPPEGMEWVLVYLHVYYAKGPSPDTVLEMNLFDFGTVSNNRIFDDIVSVVLPDPEFNISLFPGAEGEGWIAKQVFADDPSPLLYAGNPTGSAIYFSLSQ
jgi:hypothetical protein